MFGLGSTEVLVIVVLIVLLFGGKKLPQLGGALGKAINNFKKGLKEGLDENAEKNKMDQLAQRKEDDDKPGQS